MTEAVEISSGRPHRGRSDRLVLWPSAVSVATFSVLALICHLPGSVSFVVAPIAISGFLVTVVVIIAFTAILLLREQPRRAVSILLIALLPLTLLKPINLAVDDIHLALTIGLGVGQLGTVQEPSRELLRVYDWSVGLAGGPETFLIFDGNDRLARPSSPRPDTLGSERSWLGECGGRSTHLLGHYYVCYLDD